MSEAAKPSGLTLDHLADSLAGYLQFWIDFATSPRRALQPFAEKNPSVVEGKLVLYFGVGLSVAYLLKLFGRGVGVSLEDDKSWIVGVFRSVEFNYLPAAMVIAVFACAVILQVPSAFPR